MTLDLIVTELEALLGPTFVSAEPGDLLAYGRDAYPLALKAASSFAEATLARAIVWPESVEQVQDVVRYAAAHRVPIVPYGAGSGIVGAAVPVKSGNSIVVDMKRLAGIVEVDEISLTARVRAGTIGRLFEDELASFGLTCGHFPQSFNSSTIGGWIAHRGAGTFSTAYGKVDDLLRALEVVLPNGEVLRTRAVPQSAAGPDLNRLFLGSEGTLGLISEAVLDVFPAPVARAHAAFGFVSFAAALDAARILIHSGLRPGLIRAYDAEESAAHFGELGLSGGRAVLLVMVEGSQELVEFGLEASRRIVGGPHVEELGTGVGEHWLEHRFDTTALCRTLSREDGVADALEVANTWSRLPRMHSEMKRAMEAAHPRIDVYGHASHFYPSGANLYMIFHATESLDVAADYLRIVDAAMEAALETGGTITHHHGVGVAKSKWLPQEWGPAGFGLWQAIKRAVDPFDIMNPGRLGATTQ